MIIFFGPLLLFYYWTSECLVDISICLARLDSEWAWSKKHKKKKTKIHNFLPWSVDFFPIPILLRQVFCIIFLLRAGLLNIIWYNIIHTNLCAFLPTDCCSLLEHNLISLVSPANRSCSTCIPFFSCPVLLFYIFYYIRYHKTFFIVLNVYCSVSTRTAVDARHSWTGRNGTWHNNDVRYWPETSYRQLRYTKWMEIDECVCMAWK